MLQINLLYYFIQPRIFIGNYAANAQVKTQVNYFLRLLKCSGKAMEYATQVFILFLLQIPRKPRQKHRGNG